MVPWRHSAELPSAPPAVQDKDREPCRCSKPARRRLLSRSAAFLVAQRQLPLLSRPVRRDAAPAPQYCSTECGCETRPDRAWHNRQGRSPHLPSCAQELIPGPATEPAGEQRRRCHPENEIYKVLLFRPLPGPCHRNPRSCMPHSRQDSGNKPGPRLLQSQRRTNHAV